MKPKPFGWDSNLFLCFVIWASIYWCWLIIHSYFSKVIIHDRSLGLSRRSDGEYYNFWYFLKTDFARGFISSSKSQVITYKLLLYKTDTVNKMYQNSSVSFHSVAICCCFFAFCWKKQKSDDSKSPILIVRILLYVSLSFF